MGLLDFFKKRKKNVSSQSRRELLLSKGRIVDGVIIDIEPSDNGNEIAHYSYTIQGVDFESSEILTEGQRKESLKYAPGAGVGIRFDPRNQGNSIIV